MPISKPTVFVGSSSEARNTAQIFCNEIGAEAYAIPWWSAQEFGGMSGTLDGLLKAVEAYDFAVFVLTPDDSIVSRGEMGKSARDNVLFEAGLFLGRLGRDRIQIYIQDDPKGQVKVPSDLSGVIMPRFLTDTPTALTATINRATSEFRNEIRRLGKVPSKTKLVEGWSFDLSCRCFSMKLGSSMLQAVRHKLDDKRFLLVARRSDSELDALDDSHLAISKLRRPPLADQALTLTAGPAGLELVESSDLVEGYLFWLTPQVDISNAKTLEQIQQSGAELLEIKAAKAR